MLQWLSHGRVVRPRRVSTGNLALLVLVDSSAPYHQRSIVDETVLIPLVHLGLPFRLLDLAQQRPTPAALNECAAIILAQDGLASRLSNGEAQAIAEALHQGVGFVSLDWDLRSCPGPLLEPFGFQGINRLPIASNLFRVPDNGHYVTAWQQPNAFHQAKRMVTALAIQRWSSAVTPLAEAVLGKDQLVYIRHLVPGNNFEPRHYPVVFAASWGQGRAVQFAVNPRLWRNAASGHLGGMGGLFWRAIVWAARKPLLANMIPPFVTMSFDDCSGRHDFGYLEICNRHGFTPLAALFIDTVQPEHLPLLRNKVNAGQILVNTHAMSYYDLQLYDFGVAEHSEEALRGRFACDDEFYRRLGAPCARTMRDHWGEVGVRALPYLKARGRTFINTPVLIGEHKADQIIPPGGMGYWPYDTTLCFYDCLPDDNDFHIFGAFDERHLVDFLSWATVLLRESPANDIEKAAQQAAHQVRSGLSTGFFADILTHEQKFTAVSLEEWDRILARTHQLIAGYEKILTNHDRVAGYLRDKDRTWLADASYESGRVHGRLAGQADEPLAVSLFVNVDEGVQRRHIDVPPFAGDIDITA
jgi:hypothetical protein